MRETWLAKKGDSGSGTRGSWLRNRDPEFPTPNSEFQGGKTYRLPTDRDLEAYRAAEAALEEKRKGCGYFPSIHNCLILGR